MRKVESLILLALLTSCGQDFASSSRGRDSGQLGRELPGKNSFQSATCSKERVDTCAIIDPGLESGRPGYRIFTSECAAENHGHYGLRNQQVCAYPRTSNNSSDDNEIVVNNQGNPQIFPNICVAIFEGATITDMENCENPTGGLQFQED